MNDVFILLLKASCCLVALYLVYAALLRNETFFRINRFYLLAAPVISMIIPFIPLAPAPGSPAVAIQAVLDPVIIFPEQNPQLISGGHSVNEILMIIILAGTFFFFIRLIGQIIHLIIMIHQSECNLTGSVRLVRIPGINAPFSFFNRIFLPESMGNSEAIKIILIHENVHIRQAHTFDLILTEFFTALFWFNPFMWFIRRDLKRNHEYLADQGVIRQGVPIPRYRKLIFDESTGLVNKPLVNAFNVSPIKKRLIMMTKKVSSPWALGKLALVLPVMAGLIFLFAAVNESSAAPQDQNKKVQKTEIPVPPPPPDAPPPPPPPQSAKAKEIPDVMPKYPGGDEARLKFLVENIKYPRQAIHDSIQGKVFIQFNVMTDGSLSDIKVLRGIGGGCNEEAIRVIKLMPKWTPGLKNGKPIVTEFAMPIKFALK